MLSVIIWWLWMLVIGLAALPLAHRFFRRFPGRGYAFARPLGLLLTTYVLWLGGSLGLLRNSVGGALFSILAVAVLSIVIYRRGRAADEPGLLDWLRSNGRLVLAVELLFAGALVLWSLLRAYSPDLTTAGGEKFMEIMYLNSIGRSEYFPPHDAWLGGYAISYYYFGYVMMAMLARLSGLPAHLVFNVGLASLFALTCTGAFGLVYNLVKRARREPPGQRGKTIKHRSPIALGLSGRHPRRRPGQPPRVSGGALRRPAVAPALLAMAGYQGYQPALRSRRGCQPGAHAESAGGGGAPRASSTIWTRWAIRWASSPSTSSLALAFFLGDMHPHVLALPFVLLALALRSERAL